MSRNHTVVYQIPEETARVAQAAFPSAPLAMQIYDILGPLYRNPEFADLYQVAGRPAEAPARLALVLVLQTIENLSDQQAADAVRGRLDWKYALALPLDDPGFDPSDLCEFRKRLLDNAAELRLLTLMLELLQDAGLLKGRGRQRTDSTHVLAAMRTLSRLTLVAETMRDALNDLAKVAPDWLKTQLQPQWAERYAVRVEEYRLPKGQAERQALVRTIGQDGFQLLSAVHAGDAPPELPARPALVALRTIWLQQYYGPHDLRWRMADDLPPHAQRLTSPYELEARFATKRDMSWTGYKVQLTETCDDDTPHLITNVETTPATTTDVEMIETIHRHLAAHDVLPAEHLVDSGYVAADVLVGCQQEPAIDLVGPALPDSSWQAQTPEGLDVSCFVIDWDAGQVSCPAGHTSVRWTPGQDKQGDGQAIIAVQFDPSHCRPCPLRSRCTRAQTGPRTMKLRPRAQHEALQAARRRQQTEGFKELYRQRAGVEGTLSQGVRALGLRLARYRGLAKTRLQHILIAVAINVVRVVAWLNEQRRAPTRVSAFAALVQGTS